ncbi:hypothetical protein M433DRAFT_25632 [Acidomyces richmondensis BFW]|nr:MAG: hypothetical protein FE78DRAFT_33525 [Acidomyces sp. 'richmondensis']KYG44108.1 hypothetical protein M433DRAFT_25632 [Acidomyces richmondensis BFW]
MATPPPIDWHRVHRSPDVACPGATVTSIPSARKRARQEPLSRPGARIRRRSVFNLASCLRAGHGGWQMGDGRWEMGDGRWEMADGGWRMAAGRCEAQVGTWWMMDDMSQLRKQAPTLLRVVEPQAVADARPPGYEPTSWRPSMCGR